jgi:predicted transcriptional regulator
MAAESSDTTTRTGTITGTVLEKWNPLSLNRMKASKGVSKRKSASTSRPAKSSRIGRIRVGVESVDRFFVRMRSNARRLDRGKNPEPGLTLSFEDPADFLEVITPARVRLLQEIDCRAVAIFALAAALARDPSAVRRDVALLESKHLVRTRKVSNPGHGTRTLVERAAASIELSATV